MEKKQNFLIKLFSYITYKDKKTVKEFYIPEVDEISKQEKSINKQEKNSIPKEKKNRAILKKPLSISEENDVKNAENNKADDKTISTDITQNINYIKAKFNAPTNKDIVVREFMIADKYKAFITYIDGMVDKTIINNFILRPLLKDENFKNIKEGCQLDYILKSVLETNQIRTLTNPTEAVYEILSGNTLLYADGCNYYISSDTKGFPARAVEKPVVEGVILGAQEAFNETLRTNVTLVRKIIKNPNLTTEFIKLGEKSQLQCAIMYINGLTNPAIIDEVKRRINNIDIDYSQGDGMLEQLIEDNTYSIIPTVLTTERPDRTASHIVEGRVAIIVEGSPFSKIVPVTIYTLIHSTEDAFMRWPFGTLLRCIRLIGIFFATLLPALYVAMTNFHQEMIPTDLLIAIAKAKENVPFPTIVEVLLMEISFELIREAGIRIPGVIGNTLGIIGA
ncbi:MAG: spore germination protein, partial [Ruminiclostridium sp.]